MSTGKLEAPDDLSDHIEAQALSEGMAIVSTDARFGAYGVETRGE